LRALTTFSPGAKVDADTSLPLLLIAASLIARRPGSQEDTRAYGGLAGGWCVHRLE